MFEVVRRARFLDPKLFPAFAAAAELGNFTRAAEISGMTQSGVSQHIAKLEEQIGRPLFNRMAGKVTLTTAGKALLQYLQSHVADLELFFDGVLLEESALAGVVSYAMPPSCLCSPHFTQLLQKLHDHPQVRLKVTLASSPEVLELVTQSTIDFGFLTVRPESPSVRFRKYCEEEYIFVGVPRRLESILSPDQIFECPVVSYPGSDIYYNMWIRHHLPDETRDHHSLLRSGEMNSLDGAVTMVVGGLGTGVFPRHCVQRQLDAGSIGELKSHVQPLLNTIYVAHLADNKLPRRVTQVIDWFFEMLE